jgi:hypothetical protein
MQKKEAEIIIETDGTVSSNLTGFDGKGCEGAIDDILKALGKVTDKKKTKEYHKKVKINTKIKQSR